MKILDAVLALLSLGPASRVHADRLDAAFARRERARSEKLAALDVTLDAESQSRTWIEDDAAETRRKRQEQERRWPAGRMTTLRRAAATLPHATPASITRDDIAAMLASLDAPRKKPERPE